MTRFLHPDLSLDLDAIEAAARAAADHAMTRRTDGARTTWLDAYDAARARYLDLAQGHRACELHRRERPAEEARRAAMDTRERRILDLRDAAYLAPMIDDTPAAIAAQDAAERELAALTASAA